MRRTALALTLSLLLPAGAAWAQAPRVARHELANGMTVLVRETSGAAVVAVSLQVRAGSRLETADTAGITNFLHRAMIRGTARRSAAELAEAAEEIGGRLEASGEVEYAEVRGEALARQWKALLVLVAETALEPALPAAEIEKERRLLLGQIQTRADNPFPLTLDTMLRDLYGSHPYAWQGLGRKPAVERVTRQALLAHYREIYRPERLVLAVSGQAPRAEVVKTVERLFGGLPRRPAVGDAAPPGPAPTGERRVLERPAQQAQLLVGYLAPGLGEPDYPAVRVLGAVLGGGMAGRLYVELRDKRGLAYSLGVLIPFRAGPAFLVAYLGTARENVDAAEAGVLREMERIRAAPVTDDELARAKAYLLGNLAMDRRTNARYAWHLAFFEAIGAGWDFPERYARALEAVTAADVAAAARRYLVRPTIVLLRPPR